MSSYKGTRDRVNSLERAVENLEDEFAELSESIDNLRTVTEEILRTLENMSGKPQNGNLDENTDQDLKGLEETISQMAKTLRKSGGDFGSLLGAFLGPSPLKSRELVPVDASGNAGKLTSAALKLAESVQMIAVTAQQLLPLLMLIDRLQESEFFKKLISHLGKHTDSKDNAKNEEESDEEQEEWAWPRRSTREPSYWGRRR